MSDLLSLRLGALRLARRRDDVVDGAWAAARLRLDGVNLQGPDARFARDVSQRFGRRLRIARARADRPHSEATQLVLAPRTGSRRRRMLAALAAAALLVMVLLIALPQAEQLWIEPGGGSPAAVAGATAPTASPLRGRSDLVVVVVPQVTETPAPTASPTATPSESPATTTAPAGAAGPRSTGTGGTGGGSGGGSGGGIGTGTGTASPRPTPSPTPAPSPTFDEANTMHLRGRVVNSRSGVGIPGVCVAIGVVNCARSPLSDDQGYWAVDLTIGQVLAWDIKFIGTGYATASIRVPSQPGTHIIPDIRMRPVP